MFFKNNKVFKRKLSLAGTCNFFELASIRDDRSFTTFLQSPVLSWCRWNKTPTRFPSFQSPALDLTWHHLALSPRPMLCSPQPFLCSLERPNSLQPQGLCTSSILSFHPQLLPRDFSGPEESSHPTSFHTITLF